MRLEESEANINVVPRSIFFCTMLMHGNLRMRDLSCHPASFISCILSLAMRNLSSTISKKMCNKCFRQSIQLGLNTNIYNLFCWQGRVNRGHYSRSIDIVWIHHELCYQFDELLTRRNNRIALIQCILVICLCHFGVAPENEDRRKKEVIQERASISHQS